MTALDLAGPVAVVGTGTMGQGIAQVALVAGHPVRLYDAVPGRARAAAEALAARLDRLVEKDRLTGAERDAARARLHLRREPLRTRRLGSGRRSRPGEPGRQTAADARAGGHRRRRLPARHQHLLPLGDRDRRRPAQPRPLRGAALLQPCAAAAPCGGRLRVRDGRHVGHARVRAGPRLGEEPGRLRRHPGLHRQSHRAALLRRGLRGLRGPGRRPRHHRRDPARVGRLPDGRLRTDRPDRPGRQRVRDALRVGGLLPGRAVHALAGPAAGSSSRAGTAASRGTAGTTTGTRASGPSRTPRRRSSRPRTSSPKEIWVPRPSCSR